MLKSGLIVFGVALIGSLASGQSLSPFEQEIKAFETRDRTHPPSQGGVVFVGSSSIRLWKTLAADLPNWDVINRGFGGSQLEDSVRYFERIVAPYNPRIVVLFAGTNDIASGKSAVQVFAAFQKFVAKVRSRLGDIPIAYIAISPAPSRWDKSAEIKKANALIAASASEVGNIYFIDTYRRMLTPAGKPDETLFVEDRLHLNSKGYAIWKQEVGKFLRKFPSRHFGALGEPWFSDRNSIWP